MKDDKKKMLVLGVLALLLVAVGAFSFLGGGGGGTAATAELSTETGDDTQVTEEGDDGSATVEDPTKNPDGTTKEGLLALLPLAPRDPFSVPTELDTRRPAEPPKVEVPAPIAQPAPLDQARPTGSGYKPFEPLMTPLPGGSFGGGTGNVPVAVVPQYTVKGIILGAKPMAVFEDSSGNQKLVTLGGSIDGDTKVVAIEKGKVVVSYRGKHQTLVIEEEARND